MIMEWYKEQIAEAYKAGYAKCLTDVVRRCDFIYAVVAEKAKQDINDACGVIEFPEVTGEEWRNCGD